MATEYEYECCLIGGTFDRFHSGHKLLISAALTKCQIVEIYITTNVMALKKSLLIQDYQTRFEQIYSWVSDNYPARVKLFELEDSFGPAPIHETADAIAATPETVGNCYKINETRKSNGLNELAIICPDILSNFNLTEIYNCGLRYSLISFYSEILHYFRKHICYK